MHGFRVEQCLESRPRAVGANPDDVGREPEHGRDLAGGEFVPGGKLDDLAVDRRELPKRDEYRSIYRVDPSGR
jgi:hypothetical protein